MFRKRPSDDEMREELEAHVALRARVPEDLAGQGLARWRHSGRHRRRRACARRQLGRLRLFEQRALQQGPRSGPTRHGPRFYAAIQAYA